MTDVDESQKQVSEPNEEEELNTLKYDSEKFLESQKSARSQKKQRKTYDITFRPFERSKSTSIIRSKSVTSFPIVNEEKNEEDDGVCKELQKIRKIEFLIQSEGLDKLEEGLDYKHRYTKSSKALSLMDTVEEVKEDKDIDFTQLQGSFKKMRLVHDCQEDLSIPQNNNSNFHNSRHELEEDIIFEDNQENDVEAQPPIHRGSNKSLSKLEDFVDNTDKIEEHHQHGNIIEEEIKEVEETDDKQEDEIIEKSCKLLYSYSN